MYEALREHLDSAVLTLAESKGSDQPNSLIESRITSVIFYKAAIELVERFNNGQTMILDKLPENVRRSLLTPNCMMAYEHWLDALSLLHLELERVYYSDPNLLHESFAEIHRNAIDMEQFMLSAPLNGRFNLLTPGLLKRDQKLKSLAAPFLVFKRLGALTPLKPVMNG
jgi:hypothetical protein